MFSAVLALFLVAGSLALVFVLGSLLFNALQLPLAGALQKRRLAACQARARQADELLRNGDVPRALSAIRGAFYLGTVGADRRLVSAVHNHHTSLLGRLIAVTEEVQGGSVRLMSLAKVDRLLNERTDLQQRLARARENGAGLRPTLAIRRALLRNRRDLSGCLRQLVAEIAASGAPERTH